MFAPKSSVTELESVSHPWTSPYSIDKITVDSASD